MSKFRARPVSFYILFSLLWSFHLYAKPISITHKSDMDFGTVVQGDSAVMVIADTQETASNASFEVKGDKNTAYTITLPGNDSISLNGGGSNPITISSFVSFPAEGANGLLNSKGKQDLFIGATLGPVSISQPTGSYSGDFTVDVVY